jgi:hypothetical protein
MSLLPFSVVLSLQEEKPVGAKKRKPAAVRQVSSDLDNFFSIVSWQFGDPKCTH